MSSFEVQRAQMVAQQLAARGISTPRVQQAFLDVPRERFVSESSAEFAYEDSALGIEYGQTISQPYIVAVMVEALQLHGDERVLDVGTGSGYAAAVLSRLAAQVYSIERIPELALMAGARLKELGYDNVHVMSGDGTLGWPEHAPYDAIAVAASGPKAPAALLAQLAIGGRLVMPIGADDSTQELVCIRRVDDQQYEQQSLVDVRFVPLIGEQGWTPHAPRVVRARRVSARPAVPPGESPDACPHEP